MCTGFLGICSSPGLKVASRRQREAAKKEAKNKRAAPPEGEGGSTETLGADNPKPSEKEFSLGFDLQDSDSDGESFNLNDLKRQIVDSGDGGVSLREKALNDLLHSKMTLIPATDGVSLSTSNNCWMQNGKPVKKQEPPKCTEEKKKKSHATVHLLHIKRTRRSANATSRMTRTRKMTNLN